MRGDHFKIAPCIPADWPGFDVTIRRAETECRIQVLNPDHVESGVRSVLIDGHPSTADHIPLFHDGRQHHIEIILGGPVPTASQNGSQSPRVVDSKPIGSAANSS
jgi:cellobiose phosphorylase